jgi:hypothetical protein
VAGALYSSSVSHTAMLTMIEGEGRGRVLGSHNQHEIG